MARNTNGKTATAVRFAIVDSDGDEIGHLLVEPGVKMSQPSIGSDGKSKGGGKEYIVAEASLDFGDGGTFGGRITLWPPKVKVENSGPQIVRSLF